MLSSMTSKLEDNLTNTVLSNYIDKDKYIADGNLSAQLVANTSSKSNVYRTLKAELQVAKSFIFAVAFVTQGGLGQLKTVLKDLEKKGVKGRILTSTYLYFNKPEVFRDLMQLENVEVRVFERKNGSKNVPFHAKGYLFEHQEGYQSMIIGSSNLTETAIISNYEWNLRVTSLENGDITQAISEKIEAEWQEATPLTNSWIENYKVDFEKNATVRVKLSDYKKQTTPDAAEDFETNVAEEASEYLVKDKKVKEINPNPMQDEALSRLFALRGTGANKGLIISATGTGKTYLGAFDVREFAPARFLFVAHQEQILRKSLESFYQVIGGNKQDYGIFSGTTKEGLDKKYVFATVQTLSKDENLELFGKKAFDYILFDEAHHLGAPSQQKVFNYFEPKFILGMTATPERTDDFNVYELFDYNIAYEIRLQDALNEDMLTPFHYYGIEDYEIDGQVIDDNTQLERLVAPDRVKYIIKQTEYYGYSGETLHGLIFCSRKEEAYDLANELTKQGFKAKALTGDHTMQERQAVISELESGEIQYIVTVDIFNEGIDIPCVNQVVMLRNTKSSIVFIQQLGRGLRLSDNKEFVTVIDFIGNYENNYLIPIALTGDKSHSKDNARDTVDLEPLYGLSSINFTEVAKERIYRSINNTNLSEMKKIRDEYVAIKNRLGRIPMMFDLQKESIDASVIANKFKDYAAFLLKMKEKIPSVDDYTTKVLRFMTIELANGIRKHELLLLKALSEDSGIISEEKYRDLLEANNCYLDDEVLYSVDQMLSLEFFAGKTSPNKEGYGNYALVLHSKGEYQLNEPLKQMLADDFAKKLFVDAIETGLLKAEGFKSDRQFTIGKRYSRRDVCRLLNWEKNITAQNIGGYFINSTNQTCPIFITYQKSEDISETINYEDEFKNRNILHWYSKNKRKIEGAEMQKFLDGVAEGDQKLTMHLFVKKSDDEGSDFFYLGTCKVVDGTVKQEYRQFDEEKPDPIVSMDLRLDAPVEMDRYLSFTRAVVSTAN